LNAGNVEWFADIIETGVIKLRDSQLIKLQIPKPSKYGSRYAVQDQKLEDSHVVQGRW